MTYWRIVLLLGLVACLSGCCLCRPCRSENRLETEVVVGWKKPSRHPRAWRVHPVTAKVNTDVPVWCFVSAYDNWEIPFGGRPIRLSVVFATGQSVESKWNVTVSPAEVVSNPIGFSGVPIQFRAATPGTYRIMAVFDDKRTNGVAYSSPINVF